MSIHRNVVFLMESSPTSHLRFFEGLRMVLGFSVSHRPVSVLLLEEGTRILLPLHPKLLGLPPELTEVLPLLRDLNVHVLAEETAIKRFLGDRPLPPFVDRVDRRGIMERIESAEIVIPFLRRWE